MRLQTLITMEVAPFTGAWIEMVICRQWTGPGVVAPFTGAWIEIGIMAMKGGDNYAVAPFTGAWIEITTNPLLSSMWIVAPFTGAWIEMMLWLCSVCSIVSGK